TVSVPNVAVLMASLLGAGRKPRIGSGGGHQRGTVVLTRPAPSGAGDSQPAKPSSRARLSATAAASSAALRQPLPRNSTTPPSASSAARAQIHVAEGRTRAPATTPVRRSAANQ